MTMLTRHHLTALLLAPLVSTSLLGTSPSAPAQEPFFARKTITI